jgi:hypothetical protein
MTTTGRGLVPRGVLALATTTLLTGCFMVMNGQGGQPNPIDPDPVGRIFRSPTGGPPTECRGVPEEHCLESTANFADDALGVPRAEVERFVVTCIGACTAREGEFRIDLVLIDGTTRSVGGGGWASSGPMP